MRATCLEFNAGPNRDTAKATGSGVLKLTLVGAGIDGLKYRIPSPNTNLPTGGRLVPTPMTLRMPTAASPPVRLLPVRRLSPSSRPGLQRFTMKFATRQQDFFAAPRADLLDGPVQPSAELQAEEMRRIVRPRLRILMETIAAARPCRGRNMTRRPTPCCSTKWRTASRYRNETRCVRRSERNIPPAWMCWICHTRRTTACINPIVFKPTLVLKSSSSAGESNTSPPGLLRVGLIAASPGNVAGFD